jgi:type II secretory pathway pseudopilin PulG
MKTKEMKGITLVALVVTIVVLLILAGVSINTVLGDDGIIKKAKEAAETTKRVSAEEEMNRLVLEYQLAKSDENFEDFLQEKINEGRINGATDNGDGTVTISKRVDGKDYTITVKKPVAPTPSVKVGAIRVVSDSTGAGSSLGEASTRKGTTLYIMIESTISGGTTTVSPQVPYAVTENGTYKFTVTGTVNGTAYTKEVSVEVNQFKDTYEYMDKNTEVTYPDGKVWVPEGFRIADDSSDNIQGGVVIEDKDGNQFVWVPVDTIDNYKRTCYRNNSLYRYEQCSEDLPEDEKTSVEKYKGFYIGRYEAGDKESTEAKTLRSSNDVTKTVTIKKGQAPYNYVTPEEAISLAEGFAKQQKYSENIKTKLVSSYAWDTTISFIQKTVNDYASNSPQGNYMNTRFEYIDITGESKSTWGIGILIPTGLTTSVCNIYDMGGNVEEWTTEKFLPTGYKVEEVPVEGTEDGNTTTSPKKYNACRGGNFGNTNPREPGGCTAGDRRWDKDEAKENIGFRVSLFL